jgi:predicted nucleotidyltransferase component of viral defense system
MERFLYRLSISRHGENFILKGASLFLVWTGQNYRVTRDADLLLSGDTDFSEILKTFQEVCGIESKQDDGMIFDARSVLVEKTTENVDRNAAVRVKLAGKLGSARIPLQIDIGFGDIVTPEPEILEYPSILNNQSPLLKSYSRYTMVAEKFEAMVSLGMANSRLKDFYDLWLMTNLFEFNNDILQEAIQNTFSRRGTPLSTTAPTALTPAFYEDKRKQTQWRAFIRKLKPQNPPKNLSENISRISEFIMPVAVSINNRNKGLQKWSPECGWQHKT